ncbi:MAG: acyl-CoA dehydrogenase family protein [Acidimicrobiia bacterium]
MTAPSSPSGFAAHLEHDLLERARELLPLAVELRAEGEATGQVPRRLFEAAGAAGLFRMYAPREVGGHEAPPPVAAAVIELLAGVDPTLTWVMGNSGAVCFAAARLEPAQRAEVFAVPDRNFGFSAAAGGRAEPTTSGAGFRLNGEWPVVTGVLDAPWCALGGVLAPNDAVDAKPSPCLFLVPHDALEIERIWDEAVAMRATGSHRVRVVDAELPAWCAVRGGPLTIDRPLYRLGAAVGGNVGNGAVSVGVLRGAVEAAAEELATKVSTISKRPASANLSVLELLAEADCAYRSLRAGVFTAASELWEAAQAGADTIEQRASVHAYVFYATQVARETISALYSRVSNAAFFRGHPLERALRDIHALAYGMDTIRAFQHSAALVRLGLPPAAPGF